MLQSPSTVAISVVIPMFNAEKYIAVMLESLLAQTFTDFEVIIVDDCSIDSSSEIVESYREKFNGRLKFFHMKKKAGAPGAPTNLAISFAVGKYIYQVDNDDLLINTALEQLYNAAENFNAQVVQMARFFFWHDDPQNPASLQKNLSLSTGSIDKVAFLTDDVGERINILCNNVLMGVTGWQKFVRRDFLVENGIIFHEDMKSSHDLLWTIELLFYAKNYLLIPQPLYIHRLHSDSLSQSERCGTVGIEYWGNFLVCGANHLCRFFARHKFFQDNPQYEYMLLDWYVKFHEQYFVKAISTIEPHDAQQVLEKIFADCFGENCRLISYLCTSLNVSRHNQHLLTERVNELEQRLKQLTDVTK